MGRINVTSWIFEGLSEPQQYLLKKVLELGNTMDEARFVEAALQMKAILLQRLKNSSLCEG